jgi:hypothetical protein
VKNLQVVIVQENSLAELFNRPQDKYDINNLTNEQALRLFNRLESNLSPEVLTCDGELKKSEVNRRFKLFTAAQKELLSTGLVPWHKVMA